MIGVKGWTEYEHGKLAEINTKENTKLGERKEEGSEKIETEDNFLYQFIYNIIIAAT